MPIATRRHLAPLAAALLVVAAAPLGAQSRAAPTPVGHADDHPAPDAARDAAIAARMTEPAAADAHLRLTSARVAAPDDPARLAAIERVLLPYLARYADVRDAERDGYRRFAPNVRRQRVYHYTSARHALRAVFAFDAARPTSLLYREEADGRLVLTGAMYTAPASATEAELDRRVPLSAARWHQHVAICTPAPGARARWAETEEGRLRFGPAGTIATRAACDAAGGRFHARVFGWMVHADLTQTPDGPRLAWTDDHSGHGGR